MNNKQKHLLQLLKEIDSFCKEHNITYYCAAGTVLGAIRHGGFIPWADDIDILMTREEFLRFSSALKKEGPSGRSVECFDDDHEHHSTVARYVSEDSTMFCHYHITGYAPAGISIDIFVLDPVPDDHDDLTRHIAQFYAYSDLVVPTLSHSNRLPPLYSHYIDEYREEAAKRGVYAVAEELAASLFSHDEASCSNYMLRWGSQPFIYPKEYFGIPQHMTFEDMSIPVPAMWPQYLATHYGFSWMNIPSHDNRDQHNTVFDPDRDYHQLYSVRDSMYDQSDLYDLHRNMQTARCNADAICHQIEDYAADLRIRLCVHEIKRNFEKAGLPYEPVSTAEKLIEAKRYAELISLYEPYIKLQTDASFMGKRRHGWYYHILFPIIVPVDDGLLRLLLKAMLYSGRLNDALKITGIYRRAGIADSGVEEIRFILDRISAVYGFYYSDNYETALIHIRETANFSEIPQLRDYEWLSLVRTGLDASSEQKLCSLAIQSDSSVELKKAYGDLLFSHNDVQGASGIYASVLHGSRNGMFLKDMRSKGYEFDEDDLGIPDENKQTAASERISLLVDELTGLCREKGIELIRWHSSDEEDVQFFMSAASARELLKAGSGRFPANRKLLSWKSGDAVRAFDILYADTSSVDCDLRNDADLSCCFIAVRIHILRQISTGKVMRMREKLAKIIDASPYSAGRHSSGSKGFTYRQLTVLPDSFKRNLRKDIFKALLKSELQINRQYTESDLRRTIKQSVKSQPSASSVFTIQGIDVSCAELFSDSDKKQYRAMPWYEYGAAAKDLSKLDKEVKHVWQRVQAAMQENNCEN